nr:enoyl-CoA hydratase/isomerase family protein [Rhodococcus sp. 06-418-1B]
MVNFVSVEISDKIGLVTLNEPARLNPVTGDRIEQLNDACRALADRSDVHVIIVTGAGRGFCSGADLAAASSNSTLPPASGSTIGAGSQWTLAYLPQPVIAMVNGPAIGYGCELALQADIRIASSAASFALPFAKLGTVSDTGAGTWILPRLIGSDHAADLLYTGRTISAGEAHQLGLVTTIVEPAELRDSVCELASALVANSSWSLRALKQMLWKGLDQRPSEHLLLQYAYQRLGDPDFDLEKYAAQFRR